MPDKHWISDCRALKSSSKSELQNMWFCTLCLYLKKSNTSHWCKDIFSRNRLSCKKCGVHIKICRKPTTHEASVLPDSASETYDDEGGKEPPGPDECLEGLDQDEEEPGVTSMAGFITLEDYDNNDY